MERTNGEQRAFTLVEVLISLGIFSLFFAGAFSLYRMGSGMFLTGTWKFNKQKEVQRFLSILKDRLEQASNLSKIDLTLPDDQQTSITECPVYTMVAPTTLTGLTSNARVLLFTVCKTDLSLLGGLQGLCIPHVLHVYPRPDGLMRLELISNTNRNAPEMASPVGGFPPTVPSTYTLTLNPAIHSLGSPEFRTDLDDVESITLNWELASSTWTGSTGRVAGSSATGKVLGLSITMRKPRDTNTRVLHTIRAKISFDVPLEVRNNLSQL